MKLDRLIGRHEGMGRKAARRVILAGQVKVGGEIEWSHEREVSRFERVEVGTDVAQAGERRVYIMLHKPVGVLSATKDDEHQTVIDLVDDPDRERLHLVGRLDRATSGLVLLTNDGGWSKSLMAPERHVKKVYLVETRDAIAEGTVEAFARGFYFATEGITTQPAELERLGEKIARLTIYEGKYHQIKRMFYRVGNQVRGLHRTQVGGYCLPEGMAPGEWQYIDPLAVAEEE